MARDEPLLQFLRRKSTESRHHSTRFDVRAYQVKAATSALRFLARRRNVVLDLPTGAGKTNVAFIATASRTLGRSGVGKKVLYVVPNRLLIEQVAHAASWVAPELYRVSVDQKLAANVFSLRAALERAGLIITTPGLFASLMRKGSVDSLSLRSALSFVVVDEFDEFLTIDATRTGFDVRFEDAFQDLIQELGPIPLLLMSGTAPKAAAGVVGGFVTSLLVNFVDKRLKPIGLRIAEREYRQHIPVAVVHLVPVLDRFVVSWRSRTEVRPA